MASIIQKQKELEEAKARAAQKLNQVRFVLCTMCVVCCDLGSFLGFVVLLLLPEAAGCVVPAPCSCGAGGSGSGEEAQARAHAWGVL